MRRQSNLVLRREPRQRKRPPTKKESVEALKFLVHLVGDLHKPLPVSRARDRGGHDTGQEPCTDWADVEVQWINDMRFGSLQGWV